MQRRALLVVTLLSLLLCLGLSGALWANTRVDLCDTPLFLGGYSGPEATFVAGLIRNSGGWPKRGGAVDRNTFASRAELSPVADWRVGSLKVSGYSEERLLDDDPTFAVQVNVWVKFADGQEGLYQVKTWRYGRVLCPFVLSQGDGPPPEVIRVLQAAK